MSCHICGREAVDRCWTCGRLFCADHGSTNCSRCETGIAAGDKRADHISAGRLRDEPEGRKAWWRAQPAEDQQIPSCHICEGLARSVCRNCGLYYCADHAGPAHLCRDCGRSSQMGIWCMAAGLAIMAGIVLWGQLDTLGPHLVMILASIFAGLIGLAGYLLISFSCKALFRKTGKPGWAGFVPFWNLALLLDLAGKPRWWAWLYLLVLPIVPLQIILGLGLARNFGKSQEFGLGLGLLTIIFLPILAFGDAAYVPNGPLGE